MMKKKLSLNKEIIKNLDEEEMDAIYGGVSDGNQHTTERDKSPGSYKCPQTYEGKNDDDCATIADPGCLTSDWSLCNTIFGTIGRGKVVPGNAPSTPRNNKHQEGSPYNFPTFSQDAQESKKPVEIDLREDEPWGDYLNTIPKIMKE